MSNLIQLSALRKKKGLTQAALAERLGVEQPTVQRWEKGTREPDLGQLMRLADELDVEPGALLGTVTATPIGPRLYVKGEVAAGIWRPALEAPSDEWQGFNGRADVNASPDHRFGLRVVGDSMDLVYPPGTILECVSVFGHIEPEAGRRVIVVRENVAGEVEATVKEVVISDGELYLVPRSHNPAHQPIRVADQPDDIVETRIAAVVVAATILE